MIIYHCPTELISRKIEENLTYKRNKHLEQREFKFYRAKERIKRSIQNENYYRARKVSAPKLLQLIEIDCFEFENLLLVRLKKAKPQRQRRLNWPKQFFQFDIETF